MMTLIEEWRWEKSDENPLGCHNWLCEDRV